MTATASDSTPRAEAPAAPITMEHSRIYCRDLTRREARNFYYGLKLLPEPKRSAMYALYGYMRLADDIADDDAQRYTVAQRHAELDQWTALTHQAIAAAQGSGELPPAHPLWPAFADMVRQYGVPAKIFDDMIAGQRQDLEPVPMTSFAALHEYCYRVASVVGVASLYVFGFNDTGAFGGREETLQLGVDRGIAFQLTNILRDLREDAGRKRCYIPEDELQTFGISTAQLEAGDAGGGFPRFMQFQIERARSYYEKSASLEGRIQPDARPTLAAMTAIYRGILEKIATRPELVLQGRVRLSGLSKLRIAWHAMGGSAQ